MKTLIALFAILMVAPQITLAADSPCASPDIHVNAQDIFSAIKKNGGKAQWSELAKATFYAKSFNGNRTTSGAIFKQDRMIAAHNFYAMGTKLTLTNKTTGHFVCVTVADTGADKHLTRNRIDLSERAFKAAGYPLSAGVGQVDIQQGWRSDCPVKEEIEIAAKMRGWSRSGPGSRRTANADQ